MSREAERKGWDDGMGSEREEQGNKSGVNSISKTEKGMKRGGMMDKKKGGKRETKSKPLNV